MSYRGAFQFRISSRLMTNSANKLQICFEVNNYLMIPVSIIQILKVVLDLIIVVFIKTSSLLIQTGYFEDQWYQVR